MHSKRHRRERQRIAANKFRIRNGRRKQPTYRIGIAAAGEFFRDSIKKLLQWYAGNALFFANGNKPAQLEAAANGAKKGIAEWESANSGQLP